MSAEKIKSVKNITITTANKNNNMKTLQSHALDEVASSQCFLQNAACYLREITRKPMFLVLASLLCASCGNSGAPSGTELSAAENLQNSSPQSGFAIAGADTIIGPGYSGYSLSQTQASSAVDGPELAALQPVLAALELQEETLTIEPDLGQALAPQEGALTIEPDLVLAALEPQEETVAFEPSLVSSTGINNSAVTYQSIEDNGLENATYPTDDYYLAEYLYQNPDVCFWQQDKQNKIITALDSPAPPGDSTYIPMPTGGDDTSMLERLIEENAGKTLIGQGTYKIKNLRIENPIDIYDMPMEPVNGAQEMVQVRSPDVRIFNSPIDGKNSKTLAIGFTVEDGSDRFVLVNGGFKDVQHTNNANVSGVLIHAANDFYIACNRFQNIINDTSDDSFIARANSIWLLGRSSGTLAGGTIVNNYGENHQSNGDQDDSEFFTIQLYKSTSVDNPLRIFGNRTHNAGKRFTKHQEGNALVLSNYVEWNTKDGPLGKRKLQAVTAVHFGDNVMVRNNRIKISAESDFGSIFVTNAFTADIVQDNIHFDNNDIELSDHRDSNAGSHPVFMYAWVSGRSTSSVGSEATNSSANNNKIYGTGSLGSYYLFRNGYDSRGGRFEHKNNDISVPFYQSEYRIVR